MDFDRCMLAFAQNTERQNTQDDLMITSGLLIKHVDDLLDRTLNYFQDGGDEGLDQHIALINKHVVTLENNKNKMSHSDQRQFEESISDFAAHMREVAAASKRLEKEGLGTLRGLEDADPDLFSDLVEGAQGHSAERIYNDALKHQKRLPPTIKTSGIGSGLHAFQKANVFKFMSPHEIIAFTGLFEPSFWTTSESRLDEAQLLFYATLRSALVGKAQATEEGIFQSIDSELATLSASSALNEKDKRAVAELLVSGMRDVLTPFSPLLPHALETLKLSSIRTFLQVYAGFLWSDSGDLSYHDIVMADPASRDRLYSRDTRRHGHDDSRIKHPGRYVLVARCDGRTC